VDVLDSARTLCNDAIKYHNSLCSYNSYIATVLITSLPSVDHSSANKEPQALIYNNANPLHMQ